MAWAREALRGTYGFRIDPDSIEVLEDGDPIRGCETWRRVVSLKQAKADGLVQETRIREGGTWDDLWRTLDGVVAPLVAAGWTLFETYTDYLEECGDSVAYDLSRGDDRIELELAEGGGVAIWDLNQEPAPGDDVTDPVLYVTTDDAPDVLRDAFAGQGWLP